MNRIVEKITVCLVIFMLLFSNMGIVLNYGITYAANIINNSNNQAIKFDSYFQDNMHEAITNTDSNDLKLYISISIENGGYLKNGVISFINENFDIVTDNFENEIIEKIENNVITLKQINDGTNVLLELPIKMKDPDYINPDIFSKEFETKLDGIYVNKLAEEMPISQSVKNKLSWHGETKSSTELSIQKYIPFNSKENYGVLLQIKANTKVEENKLPVNIMNLELEVPIINEQKPNKVKVIANRTTGTNGISDGLSFNEENWNYDLESGIVNINVVNTLNENNEVAWIKNADDEYLISFIYEGKDIYDFVNENGFDSSVKVITNISVYNDVETKLEENAINGNISLDYKVSDIVSFNLICKENEINKGQIYSNYEAENKSEIEYNLQYIADIGYADLIDYIEFSQNDYDKFVTEDNKIALTTINEKNYTRNKRISINANIFNKILGENGYVYIYDKDKINEIKQIVEAVRERERERAILENGENVEANIVDSSDVSADMRKCRYAEKKHKNGRNGFLGLINNATEIIDGEYVLNLSEFDVNQIAVLTSKPIAEGQLKINITKVINEEQDYSKEQMETFSLLRTSMAANTDMLGDIKSDEITLAEPVSRAEIQLIVPSGNSDLSTAIEHENLELRVVLDTSSTSNALFKNPTLEIKFPKVMESIVVNDIQLANTEELEIANIEAQYNDDCNILYIELTGTQTEYTVGDALKGANIIINFNASLNMLSPSMEEQITLTYTNENTTLFEQTTSEGDKGLATTNVNIIAPTGVISASGMTGYSNTSEEVFTINNETITENIEVNSDSKTLTISGDIVNNYENDIANVKILGRLPFSGNKVIDEQNGLGSTIDSVLLGNISTSGIDTNNVEIYYSTNGEATNDVNSTSNGWTKTPSDLNTIKSYMIVINNNMGKGAHLHFSYNIEIPGELEFNSSAYTMYKVYYDNITELGNFKETKKSAILGVTTGAGPKLAVNLTASFPENAEIQEGRIVKFTATVTNEGEVEARAVKLTVPIPQGTQYVVMNTGSGGYEIVATGSNNPVLTTEQVFDLGNIKAGESIEQSYELKLLEDDEGLEDSNGRIEINHQVGATEVRMENPALSNTYKLYKVNGDIELEVVPKWEINRGLKTGDTVEFWVNFKNINKQNINNARIQTTLPEGIVVKEAKLMSNGDEVESQINTSNNKLQVTFDELIPNEKYNLLYQIEIQNYEGDFSTIFEAVGDGINTNYSNEIIYTVNDIDVSIVQTSDSPEYVKEGEEIVYNFVIKNNGNVETPILEFRNVVPDGLSFVKVESGLSNEKLTTNSTYGLKEITENIYYLEPGQEYIINLTLRANILTSENTKRVENFATLDVGNISEQESNRIVNYIEYNPEAHGENPNNGRYIITGVAWNDANINGQRDDGEALLSGIEVMLINKNNNSIVLDSTTNQEKRSVTDTNGTYRFDNLTVGNYAVIFLYDSARYNITEYRKKDVRANLNSDALNVNLTYNGTLQKAGITDTIKITNSNMRNIDIGLYEAEKFDLSINKYVSKITLTTPTIGTQTYEYNNNVAKIEVLERNVGKSSIVIEYKIVVKNEGAIAGYARKIVDYLPESLTFNSELNSDWYQENDGNLYNTSLADVELQPGEQKELTLILTKKITEDSIGIINNSAEIFESYNEQGLQDMDSTPGNQVANEDDMSSADLVISLVTGKAALYIFIIVMVLGILITGSYLIKIKVIDVNKKKEE